MSANMAVGECASTRQQYMQIFFTRMDSKLSQTRDDKVFETMQRWYNANRQCLDAIASFSNSGQYDELCKAIRQIPQTRLDRDLADCVIAYLESLPEEYMQKNRWAQVSRILMYMNNSELETASELLHGLKTRLMAEVPTEENQHLLGEIYIILGDLAIVEYSDRFGYYYRKAAEYLPNGSALRSKEYLFVDNCDVLFLPSTKAGELERMVGLLGRDMPFATKVMGGCGHGVELLFETEAAYYTGRFDEVAPLAKKTIRRAEECSQYDICANALLLMVKTALASGNAEEAERILEKLERYADDLAIPTLMMLFDCARGWLYERTGQTDKIPLWMLGTNLWESFEPPMSHGRSRLTYAKLLYRQKDYDPLLLLLDALEECYEPCGAWVALLETRILRALALFRSEKREKALFAFCAAVDMAIENDITTPFMLYGNDMCLLCQYAMKSSRFRYSVPWLDKLCHLAGAFFSKLEANQRRRKNQFAHQRFQITDQELTLLRLVYDNTPDDLIAQFLGIGANTIKHIEKNLLKKLDAENRADAVNTAVAMGILPLECNFVS